MFAARRLVASKASVRAFSAMPARKNIIQDLYIKELKAFKPTPISAKDAEGATRPWKKPVAPAAPGLEVDAASELASYESADVEVAAPSKNTAGEQVSEEWFVLEEPEDDHH
ncbi:CYFA0S09e02300g1_1 [Cyberlindnera fabianii]|uniref:CYFA0S09e02300g1_1 n=1 Tax=Cyberlindnera fabianii TaxID=36022 RepID=A0A061AYR3_CYBFA|nr:CYFA0S09e02300g1_1 [Cyberlindnera fabianii]